MALTTHGRVFTWGKVDACLGPSGFQRCTLEEPMFVEGLLREMRVVAVAAGRLESSVATADFEIVLGWEMLEMSAVGHRLLPVAFQYTMAGPSSGCTQSKMHRLKMAQSDAVQFLLMGGATSPVPHLHGLEPYPEDISIKLGHHFTRKGEQQQKREELVRQQKIAKRKLQPNNGAAITELFQWAQRSCSNRQWHITDPRLKRAAAVMVTTTFGAKIRDSLEVERDLSGFRRLALSRHESAVLGCDEDTYKDHDYEVHEELGDTDVFNGGETVASSDDEEKATKATSTVNGDHSGGSALGRRHSGNLGDSHSSMTGARVGGEFTGKRGSGGR